MRWLILLLVIILTVYYFMPEPEPIPIEETFIGEPVKALQDAQGYEDEYLKANEERRKRMEEELEKATGGG